MSRGEERFPPPEFMETDYELPPITGITQVTPREGVYEYLDVVVLAAALGLSSYLILKKRSRRWIFAMMVFSLIYFGFPLVDLVLVTGFLFLAFLDEVDFVGKLRPLNSWRPFLKVGSLAPVIVGQWAYFIGIMFFDAGYHVVDWVGQRHVPKPKAAVKKKKRKKS